MLAIGLGVSRNQLPVSGGNTLFGASMSMLETVVERNLQPTQINVEGYSRSSKGCGYSGRQNTTIQFLSADFYLLPFVPPI